MSSCIRCGGRGTEQSPCFCDEICLSCDDAAAETTRLRALLKECDEVLEKMEFMNNQGTFKVCDLPGVRAMREKLKRE